MNRAVMFGKATDEWTTPRALFDALNSEFNFDLDVAATSENALCGGFHSLTDSALDRDWEWWDGDPCVCFMNPPYSKCRAFMDKAAEQAQKGCTVVCLVPSRTDTRWWHAHVWDATTNRPRPGVEVRFIKGRLKFGTSENSAPFPSVVIVFRPPPVQP